MAASDPNRQPGSQSGQPIPPQGQRFPQAQPAAPGQPYVQGQYDPQAQPGYAPQGYPQPQADGQGQVYPQAQAYPQVPGMAQPQVGAAAAQPVARPQPRPVAAQAAARPGQAKAAKDKKPGKPGQEGSDEEQQELTEVVAKNAPPWLISAVVHMSLMIVFSLIVYVNLPKPRIELNAATVVPEEDFDNAIFAEKLGKQLEFDSPLAGNDPSKVEEPVLTPQNLPEVKNPFAAPAKAQNVFADGSTATSDVQNAPIGFALNGREIGSKRFLCATYGGTHTTEEAVQRGLQWLVKQQDKKDGSWSLVGPYGNGAVAGGENRTAATAMALLAFQGAGNTHKDGKFRDNVIKGWDWLIKRQDGEGSFFREDSYTHRFYTHGQCTIAVCELYGMTRDKKYREAAERAVKYCLDSQAKEGGWRYSPQADSDVSVTGWVLMGLQSARMAGIDVPKENLQRIEQFLDRIAVNNGSRYPYQRGLEPTRTMTAEALLCRQYLGWRRDDPRLIDGVGYLCQPENLIEYKKSGERNVYYWYYATQVCHHMEGDFWKTWNKVMRQVVCEQQVKRGAEAGSWDPQRPTPDEWAMHGGRLYVTCLSIYMLEVYYRHLPIYSKVYNQLRGLSAPGTPTPTTSPAAPAATPESSPKPDPKAAP